MKHSEQVKSTSRPLPAWLPFLVILVTGIVCYANSLHVPLQLDDDPTLHVVAADVVSGSQGLMDVFRSPRGLAVLTFALNLKLHGEQVIWFHLCNLAIHLISSLLVLLLIRQMFRAITATFSVNKTDTGFAFLADFVPFATAVLFVCHPLQTQAVTYISQRYTSLATCLYLAAVYAYFRARLAGGAGLRSSAGLWGGCAVLCAILSMKCKEIAFTLPLMLLMLEGMLFRGRLLKNPVVLVLGGMLLLIVPLQMLVLQWRGGGAGELLLWLQRATTETPFVSRHDYFLTQLRVIVTYIRLLIIPVGQNLDHDYPLYRSILDQQVLAAVFVHLIMAATAVGLVLRSRIKLSRGDNGGAAVMRLCAAGICWFYLALAVESSVIPIRDYIYEHRLYLPAVGFFLALMTGVAYPVAGRMALRKPLCWVMVLVCCLLSAATVARNHVWRSEMALWQDALAKSPAKARPYHSIGKLYYLRWKPESAVPYLLRSIELEPNKALYRITLNHCLGLLKRLEGRTVDGLKYQKGRDEVDERYLTPWLAVSYNNLGLAYEEFSGNLFLARKNYEISVSLDPQFGPGWYNLALVTARQGDQAASSAALERLRAVNPGLAGAAAATGHSTAPADQQKRVQP